MSSEASSGSRSGDVVEVAPQYDPTTVTAQAGAQMLFQLLCLMVLAPSFRPRWVDSADRNGLGGCDCANERRDERNGSLDATK
jgi:hypothetical protein